MIYLPSFIKIGSGIQKLMGGKTKTYREHGDLISILPFFQNKESRTKPQDTMKHYTRHSTWGYLWNNPHNGTHTHNFGRISLDHDTTQAVSLWFPIEAVQVQANIRPCGICVEQSATEGIFSPSVSVPLPIIPHSSSSIIIWGRYNRPVVASVRVYLFHSIPPTPPPKKKVCMLVYLSKNSSKIICKVYVIFSRSRGQMKQEWLCASREL
jgi:hypothetical protein